jgi:hypothetical protein
MPSVNFINPVSELASAQQGVSQAQQDETFAEQLTNLAVLGYGDPYAARQILAVSRAMMGNQAQKEQFWLDVVKQEKEGMKKAWELIKE